MSAPTLQAQGTTAAVTNGNLAITLPTYAANDIVIITSVGHVPNTTTGTNTMSLASPWTKYSPDVTRITSSLIDAEYAIWWARATSASSLGTSVTITRPTGWDTGTDTCWGGRAYVIRGCKTTGDPFDAWTASSILTAANGAFPGVSYTAGNNLVVQFLCVSDNTSVGTAPSGWTAGTEDPDTTGTDCTFQTFRQTFSTSGTATSTASTSSVAAPANTNSGYVFFGISFTDEPITRTATGSGLGTESATGARTGAVITRTASGSGAGTESATGAIPILRTATGSGAGTQTVTSTYKCVRTATGSGTGTQTATYTIKSPTRRTVTGSGTGTQTVIFKVTKVYRRTAIGSGFGTQNAVGVSRVPIKRTATGSGLGTQTAPWTNPTVLKTYTSPPTATGEIGNWRTSTGASTGLHLDVDEPYSTPDNIAIRGAAGVTDGVTSGPVALTVGDMSPGSYTGSRLRSARVRFRWRVTNRVDDDVSVEIGLAFTVADSSYFAGQTSTTRLSVPITSSTFVDSGWIDFPYISPSYYATPLRLHIRQVIAVNNTNDNAYVEIDSIEVETTQIVRNSYPTTSYGTADTIASFRHPYGLADATLTSNSSIILQRFIAERTGRIKSITFYGLWRSATISGFVSNAYINMANSEFSPYIASSTGVLLSSLPTIRTGSVKYVFSTSSPSLIAGKEYTVGVNLGVNSGTVYASYASSTSEPWAYPYALRAGVPGVTTALPGAIQFSIEMATATDHAEAIALGSGTSSQSATWAKSVVLKTYTRIPTSQYSGTTWLNSIGNSTSLAGYVDELYDSPDALFIRGATGTSGSTLDLICGAGFPGGASAATGVLRSARFRLRLRVVNRSDDDLSLLVGLYNGTTTLIGGSSSTTGVTIPVTSSTYVDTGWINLTYINTFSTISSLSNITLKLVQQIQFNNTNDNAYIEVNTVEVETTQTYRVTASGRAWGSEYLAFQVGGNSGLPFQSTGTVEAAQSFIPNKTATIRAVSFRLSRTGLPTGNVVARVYSLTGTFEGNATPLTQLAESTPIDVSTVPTSTGLIEFKFPVGSRASVTQGTGYFVSLRFAGGDASNRISYWGYSGSFSPGNTVTRTSSGPWTVGTSDIDVAIQSTITDAIGAIKRVSTASGSGTGAQTTTSRVKLAKSATGAGFGNQNAAGAIKLSKTATGSGTGTQTATAVRKLLRFATGSGTGTQTAARQITPVRTATGSGAGTQTASGRRGKLRTATGSGVGTQTAVAVRVQGRTATGSGSGTQTANFRVTPRRAATGSGTGFGSATWTPRISKAATGSGSGDSISATFRRNLRRTADSSGVGTSSTSFFRVRARMATGFGSATQTASGFKTRFRTATGSGIGAATTTSRSVRPGSASGSGVGTSTVTYRRTRRRAATAVGSGDSFVSNNFTKRFRTGTGSGSGNHFISTVHNNIRNAQGFGGAVTGNEAIGLRTVPRTASGQGQSVDNPYDSPQQYDDFRLNYDQSPGITSFTRALRRFSITNGLGESTNTQRQAAGFLRTALGIGEGTSTAPSYFATPISRTGSADGQGTQTDTNVTISTTHGIGAAYWGIPALVE